MVKDDVHGRKTHEFKHKKVDIRDERVATENMLSEGWDLYNKDYKVQKNANTAVILSFRRKKDRED